MSDNKAPASALLQLPDEILLQIIRDTLALPNGIHSNRWALLKKVRIDNLSIVSREFSLIMPEALYTCYKIVIKPTSQQYTSKAGANRHSLSDYKAYRASGFIITYPNFEHSHWVRELEYRLNLKRYSNSRKDVRDQISWLKKLASGTLGFSNLSIFRVVFDYNHGPGPEQISYSPLHELEITGSLYFTTRKLEIIVNGYCHPGSEASLDRTICSVRARLSKILLVKSQN
jgi:hypothetical protein